VITLDGVALVLQGMAIGDQFERDEDVEAEHEDEGHQQEQQPTQLFLVLHTLPTIIIIFHPPPLSSSFPLSSRLDRWTTP
jgi:hypothetical protein